MIVSHNVKRGVVIEFATNLGHGSCKFLARRNLNRNLGLLVAKIGVGGTPQMVFTNPIMTKTLGTHVLIKIKYSTFYGESYFDSQLSHLIQLINA
jgi:hypothetical protein